MLYMYVILTGTTKFSSIACRLYREREFSYGAMRSTNGPCATDYFFIFKVQIVDLTYQNILHIKI
jgi:hypothetical protein